MSFLRTWSGVFLVLSCAVSATADDAPKNTEPFTRYKMVLTGGIVNSTLPFDVPFIIWGDIIPAGAGGTQSFVTLQIADGTGAPTNDCRSVPLDQYRVVGRANTRKWTAVDYTDRGLTQPSDLADSTREQYEFLLNPLSPSRIYCMLFEPQPGRALTPPETLLLQSRMKPAYREFLDAFGSATEVPATEVEGLRLALIRHLLAASPLEGFRPSAGSVFDPATKGGPNYNAFVAIAQRVLTPHRNVLSGTAQLDATDPAVASAHAMSITELAQWSQRPEVAALESSPTPTVAQAARFFRSLDSRQRSNVLLGLPVGGTGAGQTAPIWEVATSLPPPPATGIYPPNTPCPTDGALASRCASIDTARGHLDVLLKLGGLPAAVNAGVAQTEAALVNKKRVLLSTQNFVNLRDDEIESQTQMANLGATITTQIYLVTTTMGSLETRRTWYVSADLGLAVAPVIGEVFPYAGVNIYFRPVNKAAPPGPFLSRFAALLGFTWTDNLLKAGERKALYGEKRMLMLGAGLRANEIFRINGGVLLLRGVDPNPLIEKTSIEVTPFVSLSADIDVAGIFSKMFGTDATPPQGLGIGLN